MDILDIIGPIMIGPSSSHTAGAVRIGLAAGQLLGEPVKNAKIYLHGSFLATAKGHGTDRALVAGLLGMAVDDARVPDSFAYAKRQGLEVSIGQIDLGEEMHPNSVLLRVTGESGKELEIVASSIGGGRIRIDRTDGREREQDVRFTGEDLTGNGEKAAGILAGDTGK